MRYLILFFLLLNGYVYSQDIIIENNGLTITMDKKIDSLIKLRCVRKLEYNMMPGWRVQIDFSDDKDKFLKTRDKFIKYHPKVETYLTFDKPYWKLIVGNYPDRNDAEKLIKDILPYYNNNSVMLLKTAIFEPKDEYIREESTK
jgi:hypothetical protein